MIPVLQHTLSQLLTGTAAVPRACNVGSCCQPLACVTRLHKKHYVASNPSCALNMAGMWTFGFEEVCWTERKSLLYAGVQGSLVHCAVACNTARCAYCRPWWLCSWTVQMFSSCYFA